LIAKDKGQKKWQNSSWKEWKMGSRQFPSPNVGSFKNHFAVIKSTQEQGAAVKF